MGPGPGGVEVEGPAGRADAGGDMQEPVADGFGCGPAELAGEADGSGPGQHVNCGHGRGEPCLVGDHIGEWQVGRSAGFEIPDDRFSCAPAAVASFQPGDPMSTANLMSSLVAMGALGFPPVTGHVVYAAWLAWG